MLVCQHVEMGVPVAFKKLLSVRETGKWSAQFMRADVLMPTTSRNNCNSIIY